MWPVVRAPFATIKAPMLLTHLNWLKLRLLLFFIHVTCVVCLKHNCEQCRTPHSNSGAQKRQIVSGGQIHHYI